MTAVHGRNMIFGGRAYYFLSFLAVLSFATKVTNFQ